jgi:hypothetical protein
MRLTAHGGDRSAMNFLLPYSRLTLLIRSLLSMRWDSATWPAAKAELGKALAMRRALARQGWWN